MGLSKLTYNGLTFPDRTKLTVREEYVYDDAGWTVKATRFIIRAETIIVIESVPSTISDTTDFYCGREMHRVRQLLSKAGEELRLEHDGFISRPHLIVGGSAGNVVRDVAMGPKPRTLEWTPIHTNAAEVIWECEVQIPICDGTSAPSFRGVSSFNYTVGYDIDKKGYTTRRIAGAIEIALARVGRNIPDTVEEYRNQVIIAKPDKFERQVTWNVSADRRRADFVITDTEIQSGTNVYPRGVVAIQARHRVNWNKRHRQHLSNILTATIELAENEPRWKAWEIFKSIVDSRIKYAYFGGAQPFLESMDVDENLYGNDISFSLAYRLMTDIDKLIGAADVMFSSTGLLQPLEQVTGSYNPTTWKDWSDSVRHLQPFQGLNDRGLAGLRHGAAEDRIVDLCNRTVPAATFDANPVRPGQGYNIGTFCNPTPSPAGGWIRFEGKLLYREGSNESVAVTLGPNDLNHQVFNPRVPSANLPQNTKDDIEAFFESYAGVTEFVWAGFAERVGYPIEPPGKLRIGGQILVPVAGSVNHQSEQTGIYFCQPLYKAFWKAKYRVRKNPSRLEPDEAIPS